jgi:hypothetical protein
MRLFWTGFLFTGLLVIGWTTYARWATWDGQTTSPSIMSASDDGSPMPPPKLR